MWTIVKVSHHFHSLSLLTLERCSDPIVLVSMAKSNTVSIWSHGRRECVKGLLNDSLLTVRGCQWCPPLTPNSMSCIGVPFSESLIVTPQPYPELWDSDHLRLVLGGRTGVVSLMYYLVNLLEEEIVSFLFPIQANAPFCISHPIASMESQTRCFLSRPDLDYRDTPSQWPRP